MRRKTSLALVALLAPAIAAVPVTVSAREADDVDTSDDEFGMDWDFGQEQEYFDEESAAGTDAWSHDWGYDRFGSDRYGQFDDRYDWGVDDDTFDSWYGDSDAWFEPGGET